MKHAIAIVVALVTGQSAYGVGAACSSLTYTLDYMPTDDYKKMCSVRKAIRRFHKEATGAHMNLLDSGYLGSSAYLLDIRSKYMIESTSPIGFLVLKIHVDDRIGHRPLFFTVDSHSISQGLRASFKLEKGNSTMSALGPIFLVDICEPMPIAGDIKVFIGDRPAFVQEECILVTAGFVQKKLL